MNLKKKFSHIILLFPVFLLLLAAPLTAWADVIWTPENSFYESHENECEYIDRQYTAKADTSLYEEPLAPKASDTLEGGATVYVSFVYRDEGGQEWGYAEQYSANQSGWARMSDLTLVYDSKEFMKDHQAELNENASETLEAGDTFYIWTYPESGKRDDSLYTLTSELTFDTAYTDSSGRLWGHCVYWQAIKDFWICLSAPGNPDIPAAVTPPATEQPAAETPVQPEQTQPASTSSEPPVPTGEPAPNTPLSRQSSISWPLIVLPIVGVIILTCILLKIFWKKKD